MKLRAVVIDNLLDGYTDQIIDIWQSLDDRHNYMFAAMATSKALQILKDIEDLSVRGWITWEQEEELKNQFETWFDDYLMAWENDELGELDDL